MDKGFLGRLAGVLAWTLLLAGAAAGPVPAAAVPGRGGPAPAGPYWEVRLTITASGEYAVRGWGGAPVAGEYACRAVWEGRLEPEGDDFLLIHIKTDILEWRLRERSGPPERESVLEAPAGVRPDLLMRYVLKDERDVEFIFELDGVAIPLHPWPLKVELELPRSSGQTAGSPGQGYGVHVCRGSSRVAVPETDLRRRSPERRFAWDWRRTRPYVRDGRTAVVTQGHSVEAVVTLARR